MKPITALLLLLTAPHVMAATPEKFTCEQIKEKAVRASCIAARDEKAEVKPVDERKAKMDQFILEAKARLTENFKDPQSAQFADLVYIENGIMDSSYLCGKVNSKNSYGGYVGAKRFFVRKQVRLQSQTDVYWATWIASDELSKMEALNLQMSVDMCTRGTLVSVQ